MRSNWVLLLAFLGCMVIGFSLRPLVSPGKSAEMCQAIRTSLASINYQRANNPDAPSSLEAQTVLESLLSYCQE